MTKILNKMRACYLWFTKVRDYLEAIGFPIVVLLMRIQMAKVFWYSGVSKLSSWSTTVYMFEHEYKTPILEAELSAFFATSFELLCPILLLLGLAARVASIPMLVMTAVIQFTYLDSTEHLYWALMLSTILFYGAGRYSVDYSIRKRWG